MTVKMNSLIPMLPVKNIAASIDFYQKLGFAVEKRNDRWGWAMLCFDDCRLMVDQSINVQPEASRQSVVYFYPEDIVEYHGQVRANGLEIPDLEITFYGLTEFRLDDPDGNRLWIGESTSVEDAEKK
jgi:catechol 2,3-dioxygenase-like lactoylglutathione lyase family enzyme